MSDEEKLDKLRTLLKEQIKFYHDHEDDEDYIYDEMYESFNNLSRNDYKEIVEVLL